MSAATRPPAHRRPARAAGRPWRPIEALWIGLAALGSVAPVALPLSGGVAAQLEPLGALAEGSSDPRSTAVDAWAQPTDRGSSAVLVGAGDVASCSSSGDERTAQILDGVVGTVVTLGDNAYSTGTSGEFANCYAPSWGRHRARTRPAPGNHDYATAGAAGYFGYFGAAAGDPSRGYYSYDLGAWHVVVINSNCGAVGGCHAGSPQEQWLRQDLAAHPTVCTLAYWHHPLFTSDSLHANATWMQPIWQALYDFGAEIVLAGHAHNYERFAPQGPTGGLDPIGGIREFVVGTGGVDHRPFGTIKPNSEVRNADTFGVLKLTLMPTAYAWQFLPEPGKTFTDEGVESCHVPPAAPAPRRRAIELQPPAAPPPAPTRR